MYQEQNNFNHQNFNIQGNNGIPSQSLNNQPMINQQPIKRKKSKIVKVLGIIGLLFVCFVSLFVIIFFFVSSNSKKLVCQSNEGKITLMYNDKTITGYSAIGMSYNLEEQKKYAEQIGVDSYMEEFSSWFRINTSGTCTYEGNNN